jgi:acyl-coenzyme A thioesterase PaaI-like protein
MDPEDLKAAILDAVPWVKMSGVSIDLFSQGHVKLSVPSTNHLNHVGIMYAGTHFMLMEVAGAALFLATYGTDKFLPINKGMNIRFLKPAFTGISCELRMDALGAREKIKPIEEKGKGEWVLDMTVTDANGITVSSSTCTYFIIPSGAG